jgi:hypothetical protein
MEGLNEHEIAKVERVGQHWVNYFAERLGVLGADKGNELKGHIDAGLR